MEVVRDELGARLPADDAARELPRDARRRRGCASATAARGARAFVLVHGWKQSHRLWDPAIARLAARHRVVAFDLRGMGESDKPNSRYTFDELAGDLAFVLDALDLEDVTLVGWSMGCTVSLAAARRRARRASAGSCSSTARCG